MPRFGQRSQQRLETCHEDLIIRFEDVVEVYDCSVLCGTRTEAEQTAAYNNQRSKVQWPNSMHNERPSLAADVVPYPVDWDDIERFFHLAGIV